MKRKLITLFLMLSMLGVLAWTPQSAECFGCTAAQKQECFDESERWMQECVDLYGQSAGNYCYWEAEDRYQTCLLVKGCPQPVKNP